MNRKTCRRLRNQGSILVLALLAVVILMIVGGGVLSIGMHGQFTAIRTGSEINARTAADAGITQALFMMNQQLQSESWDISYLLSEQEQQLPYANSSFIYKIARDKTSVKKNEYVVASMGMSGNARRTVQATVRLKWLFESAILVKNRMSLMPGTLVAGYNSADPTDTDFSVKIGTTSTEDDRIPIGPGTIIDADVFVGVDGDPASVIGAGGTITGRKYSLFAEVDFPAITAPALPVTGTALSTKGATITLAPADSAQYTAIQLAKAGGSPGVLEIAGGKVLLHITGDIDIGQGCDVIVRPDSSLILYIDGNISADNSLGFNNEAGNVKDFQIYATGEDQVFDMKAKSSIFGVIYAPEAQINIYPGGEIRGAIVGKDVTFKSGCIFYYDEALRDATLEDEGVRFVVKRWQE